MSTHNISLYKEVNKRYTDCHLKTTKFLYYELIGVCAVIGSNTVFDLDLYFTVHQLCKFASPNYSNVDPNYSNVEVHFSRTTKATVMILGIHLQLGIYKSDSSIHI